MCFAGDRTTLLRVCVVDKDKEMYFNHCPAPCPCRIGFLRTFAVPWFLRTVVDLYVFIVIRIVRQSFFTPVYQATHFDIYAY